MDERRRMQYMDALGISMYVPRFILPAAKPSVRAPLPVSAPPSYARQESTKSVQDISASTEATVAATQSQPTPGLERVDPRGLLDQLRPQPSSPAQNQVDEAPDSQQLGSQKAQSVRFSLSIWRAGERVLVLDSRQPKEALPTQALLSNILAVKGLALSSSKPEILNWPMFDHASGPQDWRTASDMVLAFLNARLERSPSQYIWVMGKAAYAAVQSGPERYQQDLGRALAHDSLQSMLVVLPSLSEMLKQPLTKRITWQAIRDLVT